MIVTPVVKAPIALRNSAGFKVIFVRTPLAMSRSSRSGIPFQRLPIYVSRGATAYITTARRCIIRGNVAVSPITTSNAEDCATTLADLRLGQPISRDAALQLIRRQDDELPALLTAARAAKENFKL